MRSGRAQLTGAAAGIVGIGALGSLMQRSTAMVLAGAAMLVLGLYVVFRFREERFVAASTGRWSASWSILVHSQGGPRNRVEGRSRSSYADHAGRRGRMSRAV
jgi:hypothetical protein